MEYKFTHLKLRIIPLIFFSLLVSSGQVNGQLTVKGKVLDASNREPLPGVNIVVKATTHGTISDFDGNFSIDLGELEKVLVFSFTGYEPQEIQIGTNTELTILLTEKSTLFDEVVVIGYGTVKKSDLTGSVSSVKSADLIKVTSTNPVQSLQGKVSGVNITSTSGAPGANPVVRIRGVGTFNNSSPIYVVDGVILDDIAFLNSADIASMEILKDASATAIYGSRGANGVVMITTKTGKEGMENALISFSGEYGIQKLTKKIDLLNGREFAIISNQINPGTYNNVDVLPNTDWQDLVFRNAPQQNYQLSISGASKTSVYYFGVGLYNQEGIIPKSNYKRITLKFNNTFKLGENIKVGNNLNLMPYQQRNAPNVTYAVYRAQPLLKPYYDDGSFGVVYNVGNPLAMLEYSNDYRKGVRGVGNIFAEATILKDFTLKSSFGMDAAYNKSTSFTPAYVVYYPDGTESQQKNELSDLSKSNDDNFNWLWENTLTYAKNLEKHNINTVAGYTMQRTKSENFRLAGQNIMRDGDAFWYIQPAYIEDESNNIEMVRDIFNGVDNNLYYSMLSYLFRVNYSFDSRYTFTATYRRDGSSKFSEENRFGNFPSFALGWNVGNESFMEAFPIVSTLKLRSSWGKIGNEKIDYTNRYSRVKSDLAAIFGNPDVAYPASSYFKNGNPDLQWETTTQTDVGLEIGILGNQLTAEFDFYNKVTEDILVDLATPGHLGNGQGQKVTYNAGKVLNRGFEYHLTWREKRGDFSYSIGLIGSFLHNEVLEIGGNSGIDSVLAGGYLGNGQSVTQSEVGLPIGAFYGYKTDGIFQSQQELDAYPHTSQAGVGDLRFVDVNRDGKINGLDRTNIGSPIPKYTFGINLSCEYKRFDLAVDIQGQTGNEIFNGKDVVRPDPYNFERHVWDRWTGAGTSNSEPQPSFGGYNYTPSDRFILDGSFVRLRSVILGYTLPSHIARKFRFSEFRVFVKATNVFTLSKFTGYTPEIGSSDVLGNGIDNGVYPIPAIYSFGLNFTL